MKDQRFKTAELELAVHCCRLAFDPDYAPAPAADGSDWPRFYRLIRFHRVQGLIWKALFILGSSVPSDVARMIAEDAARIAAANRVSLAECSALSEALQGSGIDFLFL